MTTNRTDTMEKLRRLAELAARGATEGERAAARAGADRIRSRIARGDGPISSEEVQFEFSDPWSRQLFVAMCRRRGLRPYKTPGQGPDQVTLLLEAGYAERELWPAYQEAARRLDRVLDAATADFIGDDL